MKDIEKSKLLKKPDNFLLLSSKLDKTCGGAI